MRVPIPMPTEVGKLFTNRSLGDPAISAEAVNTLMDLAIVRRKKGLSEPLRLGSARFYLKKLMGLCESAAAISSDVQFTDAAEKLKKYIEKIERS